MFCIERNIMERKGEKEKCEEIYQQTVRLLSFCLYCLEPLFDIFLKLPKTSTSRNSKKNHRREML